MIFQNFVQNITHRVKFGVDGMMKDEVGKYNLAVEQEVKGVWGAEPSLLRFQSGI